MYMCVFYVYSYFITYHRIPAGPEAFGSWPSCPLGPCSSDVWDRDTWYQHIFFGYQPTTSP